MKIAMMTIALLAAILIGVYVYTAARVVAEGDAIAEEVKKKGLKNIGKELWEGTGE